MTSSRKISVIGGVILFMLLLVWMFSSSEKEVDSNSYFSSSNWEVKYQPFDKNPRGTFLLHRLMQTHIGKNNMYVAETSAQLDSIVHMNKYHKTYFFTGNGFGLESYHFDSVMKQVEQGSHVFISFNQMYENNLEKFFDTIDFRSDYAEMETVYTSLGKNTMINLYEKDTVAREWLAFGDVTTVGPAKTLSTFMEMDNFIVIKIGKGKAFLHTNPNMFYNYQIKRGQGYYYTKYVLDQLPKKRDVVLMELGRLPDNFGNNDTDDQSGADGKEDRSFLKFIMEDPNLRTGLLLLIAGVILYVVFRSRRKRPIVPYITKNKDMTLAFTETITSIYFAKRNPYGLLQVQRKNFYANVQKHFFVDLSRREGDRELMILAEKSNRPLEEIKRMVNIFETKEASSVSEQMITEMAQKQREFYQEVGIISDSIVERVKKRELVFRRGLLLPSVLILLGLLAIFGGVYLLVIAKGVGIGLWPVGIALFLLGVMRLANPYLIVTPKELIYYSEFGKKHVHAREELLGTKITKSGVVITLNNNKQLIINYWDLSRFDRKQFERFISNIHTLEL